MSTGLLLVVLFACSFSAICAVLVVGERRDDRLAAVQRGLADMAAGRLHDRGDFSRYLDEDDTA